MLSDSSKNIKLYDKSAFENLYNEMFDRLLNYGLRLVDDKVIVEDSIQNVFIQIWNKKDQLEIKSSIHNYLYTCLRREVFHQVKRQKLDNAHIDALSNLNLASPNENNPDKRKINAVQKELENLPSRQKEIIYLKYKDNMSYEEMEAIMGISKNSLYKLLHKAISNVKASFKRK